MPTLIANWRPLAALGGLLLYTAAVWHVHSIYDRANEADRLEAAHEAARRAMRASFDIDAGFNAHIAALAELQNNLNRSTDHETPLPLCRLPAGRVSALRRAIAADPAPR